MFALTEQCKSKHIRIKRYLEVKLSGLTLF